MKYSNWIPAALGAAVLAACGGGGGSSGTSEPGGVTLSGVAAKGALTSANVDVYPVVGDHVDKSKSLSHAVSDEAGAYHLPKFTPQSGVQYVVVVSADGSNTKQIDEVTGELQPMPADFSLRALLPALDASGGDVANMIHVTPFSEMATAAAEKATFTPASVKQAASNIAQLLGFDPLTVKPATIADAAASTESADTKLNRQKLAVMLTAVSQLAKDGGLGCANTDAGLRAQCVVQKLAEASDVDHTKPVGADTALTAAIATVVADPANAGLVDETLLTTINENLTGSGVPTPVDTLPSVVAVKSLFNELRTNIVELFGKQGTAPSALEDQATLFKDTLKDVQEPVTVAVRDGDALLLAVDLYTKYKSNAIPPTTNGMSRRIGTIKSNVNLPFASQVSCSVYQDQATAILATAPENANFIGCRVNYYTNVLTTGGVVTGTENYRHGFTVTPNADGVNFSYLTRARKQVCTNPTGDTVIRVSCSGTIRTFNGSISPADVDGVEQPAYAGTIAVARVAGEISSIHIAGDLAAQYLKNGQGLLSNPNGKTIWSINATRGATVGDRTPYTFDGSIVAYKDQGTTEDSHIVIKPGSNLVKIADEPTELGFDLVAGTPKSEFEGVFSATESSPDVNGIRTPVNVSLKGTLRNAGTYSPLTDFFSGSVGVRSTAAAWANYDSSAPNTATNQVPVTVTFAGSVTAPNRPKLELSFAARGNSFDKKVTSLDGQYKTVAANGTALHTLAITGSEATGLTFAETSSGISFSLSRTEGVTSITRNGTGVAELDRPNHRVNFPNGDYVSLDFGL